MRTTTDSTMTHRAIAAKLLPALDEDLTIQSACGFEPIGVQYLVEMDWAIRCVASYGLFDIRTLTAPLIMLGYLRLAIEHWGKEDVRRRITEYREQGI